MGHSPFTLKWLALEIVYQRYFDTRTREYPILWGGGGKWPLLAQYYYYQFAL